MKEKNNFTSFRITVQEACLTESSKLLAHNQSNEKAKTEKNALPKTYL
jgi:hypothetical protein